MENVSVLCKEEEQMDLPPGFRFHPTDEELISHYLYEKVIDTNFTARAMGEVDLNKSEPWDLPCKSNAINSINQFFSRRTFFIFFFFVGFSTWMYNCISAFLLHRSELYVQLWV